MREVRIKDIDENEIDTILAEDIDFTGKLSFKKPLMIKGVFKGEIKASSDLYIGRNAVVKAKIEANRVSSKGKIEGNVLAYSQIELFASATVIGDLTAPDLIIERGCKYNGRCNMLETKSKQEGSHG